MQPVFLEDMSRIEPGDLVRSFLQPCATFQPEWSNVINTLKKKAFSQDFRFDYNSTSSSVHLAALAPELPWFPCSCIVSSPNLLKASPAEVKISPTLLELLI